MTTSGINYDSGFYVCLLSSGSMHTYTNNTQSAFTNVLARPIQLNEQWVVGLTGISINPYSAGTAESSAKLQVHDTHGELRESKRERRSRKSDVPYASGNERAKRRNNKREKIEILDDEIEIFDPTDPRLYFDGHGRRLRAKTKGMHNGDSALIIYNKYNTSYDVKIAIKNSQFFSHKFVYNTKKKLMNLGTLLEKMTGFLEQTPPTTSTEIKDFNLKTLKQEIVNTINKRNWKSEPYNNMSDAVEDELNVRVYLGTSQPVPLYCR